MKHADFPAGPLVEIKTRRCLLILSEDEIISLLSSNPDIWKTAIQRGKAIRRAKLAQERSKASRKYKTIPGEL